MSNKVIVILSGGMDSTTALYLMRHTGYNPFALSFDYGQKHSKELEFAEGTAVDLNIPHVVFDLSAYSEIAVSALTTDALGRSWKPIPEGHYADETMKATVVPNRNMTMLSVATAWAITEAAHGVVTGVHAGDHAVYPDCRPEFIYHMEQTIRIANADFIDPMFQIMAPFVQMTKTEIVKVGEQLNVPWKHTWSCYKGGEKHCGKCGTCVERIEAFQQAGVDDPTEYEGS